MTFWWENFSACWHSTWWYPLMVYSHNFGTDSKMIHFYSDTNGYEVICFTSGYNVRCFTFGYKVRCFNEGLLHEQHVKQRSVKWRWWWLQEWSLSGGELVVNWSSGIQAGGRIFLSNQNARNCSLIQWQSRSSLPHCLIPAACTLDVSGVELFYCQRGAQEEGRLTCEWIQRDKITGITVVWLNKA